MSKTTTDSMQPEAQAGEGLKLDVNVRPIAPMGNLLAFANVTIGDCFKIDGFRICSGENGLYVKYKTLAFLWLKQNRKADSWFYGMGFWTRSNAEVCLLATRGHPKRQCAGIHQFVISHIEQHSRKPDEVRDKIVKLMGDQPRVELFARQQTPGWDVWGNEVECTATMPQRKE